MYNTIPDQLKRIAIENVFNTPTFIECWKTWRPEILRLLGTNYDEDKILNLGNHLSAIFKSTGGGGRGQGELSSSGTAWESLVCWYINLCTAGSRTVAFRMMSLVPTAFRDAITVNYANFACNTESDITIITFPNLPDYNVDCSTLNLNGLNGIPIPVLKRGRFNSDLTDFLAARDFGLHEIGIIQCKTNWNDNAQIPMLWDMIYSVGGFRNRNISIGRNNFSIQNCQAFTYSFVTVPSNKKANYNGSSVAVKRVTNLSGGNYWGKPTSRNVARSISEIFRNNYNSGARTNIRTDLRQAIPHLSTGNALSYFDL